jgi:hypothetical protein
MTDAQIINKLEKLPNWGGECDCPFNEREDTVSLVHHGEWDETFEYCETCGGVVS